MNLSIQLQASLDVICDRLLGLAETEGVPLEAVANGELVFRPRTPGRISPSIRLHRIAAAGVDETWELAVGQGSAEDRPVMGALLRQLADAIPAGAGLRPDEPRMGSSIPA